MKRNYPFQKLTEKDWNYGSKYALDNAKEILKASKLCKINKIHSVGNSLMISATEELIKAVFLRIRAVTGKEPIKGFQKLFYNHKEKHSKIITLIVLYQTEKLSFKSKEDEKLALLTFIILAIGIIYGISLLDQNDRNPLCLEESRQAGLYVDLHKSKLEWLVPKKEINRENYENTFESISDFFKTIEKDYFGADSENNVKQLSKKFNSNQAQ